MKIWARRKRVSAVAIGVAILSAAMVHDAVVPQDADARSRRSNRSKSRSRKAVQPAQIKWVASYTAAQKQARSTRRLMMVDVYTDWCGACHHLDNTTYKDRKVIGLARRFVSVKINAEKGGEAFARKYKVEGYPTILFLDASGKEVKRLLGAYPAEELSKVMSDLLSPRRAKS